MSEAPVLLIGRWQPPHPGHLALLRTVLDEGKKAVIGHRDMEINEITDPYNFPERVALWNILMKENGIDPEDGSVLHLHMPDISEVRYGRDVGYRVNQVSLDRETEEISGTQIREARRAET